MGRSREGQWVRTPPGKSQVAICFLSNTGMDPLQEAMDPLGPTAS